MIRRRFQFSILQCLWFAALVALSLSLCLSEGCGKPWEYVSCVAFLPDGNRLAIETYTGRTINRNLRFYDVDVRQTVEIRDLKNESNSPVIHRHSHPGRRFVAWHPGCTTALRSDGAQFAIGSVDGTLRVGNLDDGRVCETLQASDRLIGAVAYSPDGKMLAVATRPRVILRDIASGRQTTLDSWCSRIRSMAFSEDGALLAVGA